MGAVGFSSGNTLISSATPITGYPHCGSAWVRLNTGGSVQTVASFCKSSADQDRFALFVNASNQPAFVAVQGGSSAQATVASALTGGVWTHLAWSAAGGSSRSIWMNGGGKVTNASLISPAGLDRYGVGVRATSTLANYATGLDIAELAVWDGTTMSDAEAAALAAGKLPQMVQPAALSLYLPMIRLSEIGHDLAGSAQDATLSGSLSLSSAPAHPTVYRVARLRGLRRVA